MNEKQNNRISFGITLSIISIIISTISVIISARTSFYGENKDQTELIRNTKIAMCQVGQIIHFQQSGTDQDKIKEQFNKEYESLQNIDLKVLDDDTLDYIIKIRNFYSYLKGLLNSDDIQPLKSRKIWIDQSNEYKKLLQEFNKLKDTLHAKYNISVNC